MPARQVFGQSNVVEIGTIIEIDRHIANPPDKILVDVDVRTNGIEAPSRDPFAVLFGVADDFVYGGVVAVVEDRVEAEVLLECPYELPQVGIELGGVAEVVIAALDVDNGYQVVVGVIVQHLLEALILLFARHIASKIMVESYMQIASCSTQIVMVRHGVEEMNAFGGFDIAE